MKKILFSLVAFAFVLFPINLVNAQEDTVVDATEITYEVDTQEIDDAISELESMWEDMEIDKSYTTDISEDGVIAAVAGLGVLIVVLVITVIVGLIGYVYSGITMTKVAKILKHDNPWFAWVPILNLVQIFQLGDLNPVFILLVLIPGVGAFIVGVMSIIAMMNISEKRGYNKALGLLTIVPVAKWILLGILAWGKSEK
jgi:hypothetical protein